ncbi:hypothetical protein [Kiloniella sp. b19]|uniref:hypothetical protein n=1 Tax=Kiloniella sp. GXU_MW_B19 TaxID=3141326 RepID=UPI0031DBA5FC
MHNELELLCSFNERMLRDYGLEKTSIEDIQCHCKSLAAQSAQQETDAGADKTRA